MADSEQDSMAKPAGTKTVQLFVEEDNKNAQPASASSNSPVSESAKFAKRRATVNSGSPSPSSTPNSCKKTVKKSKSLNLQMLAEASEDRKKSPKRFQSYDELEERIAAGKIQLASSQGETENVRDEICVMARKLQKITDELQNEKNARERAEDMAKSNLSLSATAEDAASNQVFVEQLAKLRQLNKQLGSDKRTAEKS